MITAIILLQKNEANFLAFIIPWFIGLVGCLTVVFGILWFKNVKQSEERTMQSHVQRGGSLYEAGYFREQSDYEEWS